MRETKLLESSRIKAAVLKLDDHTPSLGAVSCDALRKVVRAQDHVSYAEAFKHSRAIGAGDLGVGSKTKISRFCQSTAFKVA